MNARTLKQANNARKTLQIVRNNKAERTAGGHPNADPVFQNHSSFLISSKAVPANIIPSQERSALPPQPKKVSFNESRTSFSHEQEGELVKDGGAWWKGRSSSSQARMGSRRGTGLEQAISSYVEMLRGRGVLHTQHNYFTVESNKLSKLLAFIICAYNGSQNILQFQQKLVKPDAKFTDFMRKGETPGKYTPGKYTPGKSTPCEKLSFKRLLSLSSKVYEYTISDDSHTGMQLKDKKMDQQALLLREQVVTLRQRRDRLEGEVAKRHNQFTIISFQIEKLQYDFDQYIKREEYLKGVINTREAVLAELDHRRYNILRVLQEPSMTKQRQCFEETRRMEEGLFLFAEFLQCNPLGSRSYEHSKRAVCNERLLEKELREMKRIVVTGEGGRKEDLLGAFLGRYHQEYRQIIEELHAVIAEKTSLITKFTTAMAEWREKHTQRHMLLAVLKDAFLLEEIQSETARRVGEEFKQATDNLIKLFKFCHPLF